MIPLISIMISPVRISRESMCGSAYKPVSSSASDSSFCWPDSHPYAPPHRVKEISQVEQPRTHSHIHSRPTMKSITLITLLSLSAAATFAAPVPDAPTGAVALESRQWLGTIFRGVGRAAKRLPEKAGKKVGKEKGDNNVVSGKRLKETTARWTKYLGKEQDPKCVQGWMNKFSEMGGFNAAISCDKNRKGGPGKGGSSYPSVPKAKSSLPKTKSGGYFPKIWRELSLEDEMDSEAREFFDEGLEGRDLVPVRGDLLEREFAFEFDLDERDSLLDLELEELD
ncbi:hypothetical protein DFP72DRAFT_886735 [Ephemerocybe angulata]|uniref:Uncharacterized protein n=1 Tax=Ephemerocybe angulata TaxID=980116 RepID=A0A8H6M8H4_9AGAR|nr:hypothetical protein DFP72DRAFT_886735 [Tulosesus angulatus]